MALHQDALDLQCRVCSTGLFEQSQDGGALWRRPGWCLNGAEYSGIYAANAGGGGGLLPQHLHGWDQARWLEGRRKGHTVQYSLQVRAEGIQYLTDPL